MGTMSYCAIENTRDCLGTAMEQLEKLVNEDTPINEYERRNLPGLVASCKWFVELYEQGMADGIIDENGRLLNGNNDENDEDNEDY
jgi:hypothetical protein